MFSDPNKYIVSSIEMQDEYLTSPTNEAYAHYVKPTKEEQQYLFDPPSVLWRSFPVWPSYYLFAEKRGPKDQYTEGLKLDLGGACWYWYYTGDLDDKSHQGSESKQGSPERTWVIYILKLYIVGGHRHTRRELIGTWFKIINHYTQYTDLCKALHSALRDPYWTSRQNEDLWRRAEAARQGLMDLQARRFPLAFWYGAELQTLHIYEEIGLPLDDFNPLEPDMPEITYDSLLKVHLIKESVDITTETHCYGMTHPPPTKLPDREALDGSDKMSIWIMEVTELVKTTPIPQEEGTPELVASSRSLLSQLRSQSNPLTGSLTPWLPVSWINKYYGHPPAKKP